MHWRNFRVLSPYLLVAVISLASAAWILKLWRADFSIPFFYGKDSLFYGLMIKGMIQNGWYWYIPHVGMPYGLNFLDFPRSDNLHLLILKFISLFLPHYGVTINLFYLLGFPLTAISSLYVFRRFKISLLPASVGTLLYTLLPYHFFRNVGHLFLASYYLIPLIIMVTLWVSADDSPLENPRGGGSGVHLCFRNPYLWGAVIICLLVSSGSLYYSFFGCFFLLVSGVLASGRRRKFAPLLTAGVLTAVILVGTLLNLAPNLYHLHRNGKNVEFPNRTYIDAEVYGIKISQLLLPIQHHRISAFSRLKDDYNKNAPLVNENEFSSLGLLGGIGFIFLIVAAFSDRLRAWEGNIRPLAYLNLAGILLATIGGVSTFVAIFFPYIRAYNRISVYLAFFSIFGICIMLEKLLKYWKDRRNYVYPFLIFLLLIGVWEQTSPAFVPPHQENKIFFREQAQFIGEIESIMAPQAMIFQLPYVPFPENPPVHKMEDYDHLRGGYLFSRDLRWSYGAMMGRESDSWQKLVASSPIEEFVDRVCFAGFQGIYIDRYGYEDEGASVEKKISEILGKNPMVSSNRRYVFYSLTEYENHLKERFSDREWGKMKDQALYPLFLFWWPGFSVLEGTPENNWRWCSRQGTLCLNNLLSRPKKIQMNFTLATGYRKDAEMYISGDLLSERLRMNSEGVFLKKTVVIPPGRHLITFKTDAKAIEAAIGDPRTLVFRLNNFRFQELE